MQRGDGAGVRPLAMGLCQAAAYEKPLHRPSAFLHQRHDHRPGGDHHEPEAQLGESLAAPRPKKTCSRDQTTTFHAVNKLYAAITFLLPDCNRRPTGEGPNRTHTLQSSSATPLT